MRLHVSPPVFALLSLLMPVASVSVFVCMSVFVCALLLASLALCAVLYCLLVKASHPELAAAAAAAAAEPRGGKHMPHSAAEVVAAARKKVTATWQQSVAHMQPGLQVRQWLVESGWGGCVWVGGCMWSASCSLQTHAVVTQFDYGVVPYS